MKRVVFKLLALVSLMLLYASDLPKAALAADDPTAFRATNFQVVVKPEYDDPRTLVVYSTDLYPGGNATVKKGTPVSFVIPKDAQIGMACEINAQGGHECQPYSSKDLGDGKVELSWKSSKDIAPGQKYPVYLEFYYDNKTVAPNKTFTYNFNPTFDTGNLAMSFTQPKTAANFQLDPAAASTSQDQDGLTTYIESFSNKTPKDSIAIKVSYNKNDNKPTFDKPQVGSQQTNGDNTSNSRGNWLKNPTVLIPLILFLAVMAALIAYAVKNPKQLNATPTYHRVKKTKIQTNTNNSSSKERKKLRQALLDGRISEETYKELLAELDD